MSAVELGWQRRFPLVHLDAAQIAQIIGEPVLDAAPLSGGLRNTNYRVRLATGDSVVLRLYTADEPRACERECAVLALVQARVPAPRVLRSDPSARPAWSLLSWLDGTRFDLLLDDPRLEAMAYSAGATLAGIHGFTFPRGGFLDGRLEVGESFGLEQSWRGLIEGWVVNGRAGARLGDDLTRRLMRFVDANAQRFEASQPGAVLVHADFKPWNLLIQGAQISGVLDWEFVLAGSPLLDVGVFMRHSARLPDGYRDGFVRGYREHGGQLADDWLRTARLMDLICLTQILDRGTEEDPTVTRDLAPLVEATVREYA